MCNEQPKDVYQQILNSYWGYVDFRGIQREIIESIGQGQDTLGLMPTGGGKSITFQVPALASTGVCIVITPLIALMKDQVNHLKEKGILAAAIYTGMSRREILKNLDNCILGNIKFLYISPERLSSELFLSKVRRMKICFITVDEAHCISQWGYDFRPSYLEIVSIREILPDIPVLALTATATPEVVEDIQNQLSFKNHNVYQMSFERPNLSYVVRKTTDKENELIHILNNVSGSAIVYVRSRRKCKVVAEFIEENSISATFYHAGLEPAIKDQRQKEWHTNIRRVMVATNAFGMGIDKPDVKVVVHLDCPDSIEAYFQEAGRAGRDGKRAYAVLLWNNGDIKKLQRRITDNFPEKEHIKKMYDHLAYYYQIGVGSGAGHTFPFHIDKFSFTYKFLPVQVNAALKILQNCGYIRYEHDPDSSARLKILLKRHELYKLHNLSPAEDKMIITVLRLYGGLFADYQYIDEALIADQVGLTIDEAYQVLKGLSHKTIIHFIPQRKTPLLTYLSERVDSQELVIPREIYDNRKEQFIKRINAIAEYATNDLVCRNRQLVRYFGQNKSKDCKNCDVCLSKSLIPNSQEFEQTKELILTLLADNKRHYITELYKIKAPQEHIDYTIKHLVNEEVVHIAGSYLYL